MAELKAHDLGDKSKPWGEILFLHTDGKKHTYYSYVNTMSGDRLSAFDGNPPSIGDTIGYVKSVFRDIRKKAEVLECIGTF